MKVLIINIDFEIKDFFIKSIKIISKVNFSGYFI